MKNIDIRINIKNPEYYNNNYRYYIFHRCVIPEPTHRREEFGLLVVQSLYDKNKDT